MENNEDLKKAVVLIASVVNAGDAIGHETGWKERATELLGLIPLIKDASSIDFAAVREKLKVVDATERADMLAAFNEKFKLVDSELEATIEKGIDAVVDLVAAGSKVLEFVKEIKNRKTAAGQTAPQA